MGKVSIVRLPSHDSWMSRSLTDDKSTLVQVMAGCRHCRKATGHYLSQFWPRSMSLWGITRPQWLLKSWHVDVLWPLSELIELWSRSVDFPSFITSLTLWNKSSLGYPAICRRTHGKNALKVGMQIYPDQLQNWLNHGHGKYSSMNLA